MAIPSGLQYLGSNRRSIMFLGGIGADGTPSVASLDANGNVKMTNSLSTLKVAASLTYTGIATLTSQDQTVTVSGAAVGDCVSLGLAATPTAGIVFQGFVSAANTVSVRAHNYTAGTITPGSIAATVKVLKDV